MRTLTWTVGERQFAVETTCVVEVVPVVEAQPTQRVGPWMKGLMDYRGSLIPLLDVASLLENRETELRRACRILVVCCTDGDERLGLLVETVSRTEDLQFDDPAAHPGLADDDTEWLGPVALRDGTPVQLLRPEAILSPQQHAVLFGRTRSKSP